MGEGGPVEGPFESRMIRSHTLFLSLAVALVVGCDDDERGSSRKSPPTDIAGPRTEDCVPPACRNVPLPPSSHAVRLTHAQWENTVRDLLHLPAAPGLSASFPADPAPPNDRFGYAGDSLVVTNALWHEYQRAAEALADLVISSPSLLDAILPATAKAGNDIAARVNAFVQDFVPRAYRRPATPADVAAAIALGDSVVSSDATADPFLARVRWILAGVLQSASFLYRLEGGEGPVTDGRARLGSYELASKLAYALWGTMPDDTLRGQAASGTLSTRDGLASIVKSMVAAPGFDRTLVDFHELLFKIPAFSGIVRPTNVFPKYYPRLGVDAQEDVRRTIRDLVVTNPGTVIDLYASKTAWVNASLAGLYGIDPSSVPGLAAAPHTFVRVEMPGPRSGILSHVGWLAMEGKAKDPATIQRGVFVARHALCLPLGGPPAAAVGKDPSQVVAPTNRERVSRLTAGCGDGCHGGAGGVINPFGFAFEEFDALGELRSKDGDFPIDSTGSVESLPSGFSLRSGFVDAASLMSLLSDNPWTHACYAAHWNAYLNGITDLKVSSSWLAPIVTRSLQGASVRELVAELVQQDAFTTVSR
jgi:hypothetical protein